MIAEAHGPRSRGQRLRQAVQHWSALPYQPVLVIQVELNKLDPSAAIPWAEAAIH